MTPFEEAIQKVEDTDLEDFKFIWNQAVEECAKIADESLERELAYEYRKCVKEK